MIKRWSLVMILTVYVALAALTPVTAQDGMACEVVAINNDVNIRSGPGAYAYEVVGVLPRGNALPVLGTSTDGDWYAVDFHETAWIAAWVVIPRGACDALPTVPDPGPPVELTTLQTTPVLPTPGAASAAIFARGQALGNDPHVFTKVGDCNTETGYFLSAFDENLYDLGPYADLEPTIDFFAGSWAHYSLAGRRGFNAQTMLNALWADPNLCRPGEGVLACEYRRALPSVAVIMFGPNDMLNLNQDQFRAAVVGVVELSIARGVIPVLTTFTWHKDRLWHATLRFNMITVEIAQDYDIPLINFWRAAQALPDRGLVAEYTHLTDSGFAYDPTQIVFRGQEDVAGYARRNLLTLQTLDLLRREVILPGLAAAE